MGIPIDFPTSLDTAAARYACLAAGVLEYVAISRTPSPAVITKQLNLPPRVGLKTIFGVDAGIISASAPALSPSYMAMGQNEF